ncbi:MAG: hypothetical protein FWB94_09965 [Chitinispirillia bacterium]|nr:hypothetical protein [Chitinispirillia bacterium]
MSIMKDAINGRADIRGDIFSRDGVDERSRLFHVNARKNKSADGSVNTSAAARFAVLIMMSILLTLLTPKLYAGYNPMMRPDQRVNNFANRIYARCGILPEGFHHQPMATAGFLAYLDSLSSRPLTEQERYTLNGLHKQLSADKGLYGFQGDDNQYGLIINLDLTADGWARSGGGLDTRLGGRGIITPQLRGYLGKISFYSSLDVWTEYARDTLFPPTSYQPYQGIPYELYGRDNKKNGGNVRSSDLPRAGISYDAGRISLQAAIDYLRLGPAVHYPITLSGAAPPITYVRAVFDMTHVKYHHIAGSLRSQSDKPKYIYANGISGSLLNGRLQWGINEVMVSGSSTNQQDNDPANTVRPEFQNKELGWEPAFFIPFVPMVIAEHYVGDKNNAAIAFDFALNWPQDFRFYGEFFMDDMLAPWDILSDDWGNKWAVTLGAQYFTGLYGRDVSAGIEFSRVEPWVYTHFYGGSHRYDHFDKPLGAELGPNSMAIAAHCDAAVTKKITAGFKMTSISTNQSARGGKITDVFQDPGRVETPDSETKTFLGPGTIHYLRPGIYGQYDPLGIFRVNASIEIDAARDAGSVRLGIDGGFRF